jgi:translation initiation factor IF-2
MVVEGSIFKNKPVRVLRDDVVIHQGELDSLRRFKDDVGGKIWNRMWCWYQKLQGHQTWR